jgi:hypothetical protein
MKAFLFSYIFMHNRRANLKEINLKGSFLNLFSQSDHKLFEGNIKQGFSKGKINLLSLFRMLYRSVFALKG